MLTKGHFWKDYNQDELNLLSEQVYTYYKVKGFPAYNLSREARIKEYKSLQGYCQKTEIIDENIIKQSMHGLALSWCYFSHFPEIRCGKMKTPMEAFEDDDTFKSVIAKRLKYGTYLADSGILKSLKTHSGVQSVSNFRPSAAYAIYDKYCKENSVVWDMSGGFGGRMLGASVCPKVKQYIFTEPDTRNYSGLVDLAYDIKNYFDGILEIEGWKLGSEDFTPNEKIDLAFTSPPYHETEKYSDEPTQSYIKFPQREDWLDGFLGGTIKNVSKCLKPEGKLIINIKNVKTFPNLEQKTVELAGSLGYTLLETLQLSLSSMMGNKEKYGKFKYEPVFVFGRK